MFVKVLPVSRGACNVSTDEAVYPNLHIQPKLRGIADYRAAWTTINNDRSKANKHHEDIVLTYPSNPKLDHN